MAAPIVYGGYILGAALIRYAARRAAREAGRRAGRRAQQRRRCRNGRCDKAQPEEWHHEFLQQFRRRFEARNIDIDAPYNGRVIPRREHRIIHAAGYNPEWRIFLYRDSPFA